MSDDLLLELFVHLILFSLVIDGHFRCNIIGATAAREAADHIKLTKNDVIIFIITYQNAQGKGLFE